MLHLKLPTDPRWADLVGKNIEYILNDHAHCEHKAASTCMSLIVSYSEWEELVDTLTPIVAEEWAHFERVLEEMKKRGFKLGHKHKDEYVNQLLQHVRKTKDKHKVLLDRLLVAALIEARSCERFKTLWKNLDDEELQKFYYELMVSEAAHYTTFIQLARNFFGREVTDARWEEFLALEADIIASLGDRPDRVH